MQVVIKLFHNSKSFIVFDLSTQYIIKLDLIHCETEYNVWIMVNKHIQWKVINCVVTIHTIQSMIKLYLMVDYRRNDLIFKIYGTDLTIKINRLFSIKVKHKIPLYMNMHVSYKILSMIWMKLQSIVKYHKNNRNKSCSSFKKSNIYRHCPLIALWTSTHSQIFLLNQRTVLRRRHIRSNQLVSLTT